MPDWPRPEDVTLTDDTWFLNVSLQLSKKNLMSKHLFIQFRLGRNCEIVVRTKSSLLRITTVFYFRTIDKKYQLT